MKISKHLLGIMVAQAASPVAVEIETVPLPKAESRTPKRIQHLMDKYSDAYKAVYGIPAELSFDGTYIRVLGQKLGMKPKALRRATNQLKYRAG